jgi:hypothetical protein
MISFFDFMQTRVAKREKGIPVTNQPSLNIISSKVASPVVAGSAINLAFRLPEKAEAPGSTT